MKTTPLEALEKLKMLSRRNANTNDLLDIIETTLKEYEWMKQAKIIVADKKINDDDLEKLKNQRMFVGDLEKCEIKLLFDEKTRRKLKALEIIKEKGLINLDFSLLSNEEYEVLKELELL